MGIGPSNMMKIAQNLIIGTCGNTILDPFLHECHYLLRPMKFTWNCISMYCFFFCSIYLKMLEAERPQFPSFICVGHKVVGATQSKQLLIFLQFSSLEADEHKERDGKLSHSYHPSVPFLMGQFFVFIHLTLILHGCPKIQICLAGCGLHISDKRKAPRTKLKVLFLCTYLLRALEVDNRKTSGCSDKEICWGGKGPEKETEEKGTSC